MASGRATGRGKRLQRCIGMALALAGLWAMPGLAAQDQVKATVVDRFGNRHEVSRFAYQQRPELEYYVGDVRQIRPFGNIDRIVFQGSRGDEEQAVSVHLRNGATDLGTVLTGGNTAPRAHDSLGGGRAEITFTGASDLGPFYMRLNDVREVIIHHAGGEAPAAQDSLKAAIITAQGQRFDVAHLRYEGTTRFTFSQGRKRRPVRLEKIARLDFADDETSEAQRPVTITLWSGKTLQGTVDISTSRLPGETDRAFHTRRAAVFTGEGKSGSFAIGLRQVKHVRFEAKEEGDVNAPPSGAPAEGAEDGGAGSSPPNPD